MGDKAMSMSQISKKPQTATEKIILNLIQAFEKRELDFARELNDNIIIIEALQSNTSSSQIRNLTKAGNYDSLRQQALTPAVVVDYIEENSLWAPSPSTKRKLDRIADLKNKIDGIVVRTLPHEVFFPRHYKLKQTIKAHKT